MNMKTHRGKYPGMPDPVYGSDGSIEYAGQHRYSESYGSIHNPNNPTDRAGYGSRKISENSRASRPHIPMQTFAEKEYHEPYERKHSRHHMDDYGYAPQDYVEVYAAINARQLSALMFHSEMADLFGFLNLKGFQDMHEHQYLCESACYRALRNFYMAQYGKVLEEDDPELVEVFPESWYGYKRSEVTPEIRRQAVQTALEQYLEWEEETKECYTKYASMLMSWGKTADHAKIHKMIKEVDEEIKRIERMHMDLKSTHFSMDHIMTTQAKLSRKYDNCYLGKEDMTL